MRASPGNPDDAGGPGDRLGDSRRPAILSGRLVLWPGGAPTGRLVHVDLALHLCVKGEEVGGGRKKPIRRRWAESA